MKIALRNKQEGKWNVYQKYRIMITCHLSRCNNNLLLRLSIAYIRWIFLNSLNLLSYLPIINLKHYAIISVSITLGTWLTLLEIMELLKINFWDESLTLDQYSFWSKINEILSSGYLCKEGGQVIVYLNKQNRLYYLVSRINSRLMRVR